MNLLKSLKQMVYPKISRHISRAILAEGPLRGSGRPFRCLFVDNSLFTEYMLRKMYAGQPRILREWKLWIPALRKLVRPPMLDADLCIAVLPSGCEAMLRGLYAFRGGDYVRQVIDTSADWEVIKSRFHKKKRQISNNIPARGVMSFRISRDAGDFDFFYHRMHLPHIRKQFGERSDIDSYEFMKEYFSRGFLLLVMMDGQSVTGALSLVENGVLIFRRTGVLDGNEEHIRSGAQMALYYFQLLLAKEWRLRELDTMSCRPFLNDSVYRTKREWGAAVYPDRWTGNRVYYFVPRYSGAAARFFANNPAIVNTEDGLMGIAGMDGPAGISEETGRDLYRRFHAPGLGGLLLVSSRDTETFTFPFKEACRRTPAHRQP